MTEDSIYMALGELKSGAKERKDQIEKLFDIFKQHGDNVQQMHMDIKLTLDSLVSKDNTINENLAKYALICKTTDEALSERIKSVEDDRMLVRGAAKGAVLLAGVVGFGTTCLEIYKWVFKGQ